MKSLAHNAAKRILETAAGSVSDRSDTDNVFDWLNNERGIRLYEFSEYVYQTREDLRALADTLSELKDNLKPEKGDEEPTKIALRLVTPIVKESSAEILAAAKALLAAIKKAETRLDKASKVWYKQAQSELLKLED